MFNKLTVRLGHKKAAALLCICVAVILIAVNVLITALPSAMTKYDVTGYGMYTMSDSTVTEIKKVDTPVDIYIMMYSDQSNETMMTVLERYEAISKHITVHTLDMEKDLEFILKRYAEASDTARKNS